MGRPKKVVTPVVLPPWMEENPESVNQIKKIEITNKPSIISHEWQEYILNQLTENDTDKEGHPRNFALGNLVSKNLGTIVYNVSKTIFGATDDNGLRATANHELHIRWDDDKDDVRIYGDTADCYSGTAEPEFARHAAAMAGTRAQSRTYRKALNIDRIISAEEATSVPITESNMERYIARGQIDSIDTMCKKLNINALNFINCGDTKYKHPSHVLWAMAATMLENLGKLQRMKPEKLQETKENKGIEGYEVDWFKNAEKA